MKPASLYIITNVILSAASQILHIPFAARIVLLNKGDVPFRLCGQTELTCFLTFTQMANDTCTIMHAAGRCSCVKHPCVTPGYNLQPFPAISCSPASHHIFNSTQTCMTIFCSANPMVFQQGFDATGLDVPDMTQQTTTSTGKLQATKSGPP